MKYQIQDVEIHIHPSHGLAPGQVVEGEVEEHADQGGFVRDLVRVQGARGEVLFEIEDLAPIEEASSHEG